ncbi:MAG: thioredoxin family protein [Pirellulaceae bacterium]
MMPRTYFHPLLAFSVIGLAVVLGIAPAQNAAASPPTLPGKYNQVLDIGSVAPEWEPLPATDGKQYGSDDLGGAEVTVIVFTCNTCPYAIDYEERLQALQSRFADDDRVSVVAINSNAIPADSLEAMRERVNEREFTFLYLKDENCELAEKFGAVRTPEWFVLNRDRKVVYMGAFDDETDSTKVERHYVEDAIESVLEKAPLETAETPPVGCLIRRPRRRR